MDEKLASLLMLTLVSSSSAQLLTPKELCDKGPADQAVYINETCFKMTFGPVCTESTNGQLAALTSQEIITALGPIFFSFTPVQIGLQYYTAPGVPTTGWYWTQANNTPCPQPAALNPLDAPATGNSLSFQTLFGGDDPTTQQCLNDTFCGPCSMVASREPYLQMTSCDGLTFGVLCQYGSTANTCPSPNATGGGSDDPHFTTFDGLKYDSQTTCPYVLSQPCNRETYKAPYWSITAKNILLSHSRASMVGFIQLAINGNIYSAEQTAKNVPITFKLNDVVRKLPFGDETVNAHIASGKIIIQTNSSITIQFSYAKQLVTVPALHNHGTGILCGLLGDFNGDCTNDLVGRDGKVYAVPTKPHCKIPVSGPEALKAEVFADTWITERKDNCLLGAELKNGRPTRRK